MINFDDVSKKNMTKHNPSWPKISDHPFRVLIIGSSGSGKTNSLINLINQQLDVHKIYVFAKDSYKVKYQFLINKREFTGLKHFHDSKVFI